MGFYDGPYPGGTVSSVNKQAYQTYDEYSRCYGKCEIECVKYNTSPNPLEIQYCIQQCKN